VEQKVVQKNDDLDDDSEDEQPPAKKQTKSSVAKNPSSHNADEKGEKWDQHYRAMIEFCATNNNKLPKQKLVYEFEGLKMNLGSWVDVLKQRCRGTGGRTGLNDDEKALLEQVPAWITGRERVDGEDHWQLMYGLLKEYEKKEGKLPTTRTKEQFQEYPLKEVGIWVQTQKKRLEVKGGLHGFKDNQLKLMREVPSWLQYEDKVAKRIAQGPPPQAAVVIPVAQVAAAAALPESEPEVEPEPVILPLALTAMSIFKENKAAKGGGGSSSSSSTGKSKGGGKKKGKDGDVKQGQV
jgi:hypothetical protein